MPASTSIPSSALLPQDFARKGTVRTAITPADFLRHAPTTRTALTPDDFTHHLDVARASVSPQELNQHPKGRSTIEKGDLSPFASAVAPLNPTNASDDQALMEYAQKWVSQTFFGTLLKQMRESPFKSDLFSGGRGGEAFGGLYDQHLADRMARASGKKLAESIVRQLRRQRSGDAGRSGNANGLSIAA